MTRPSGERGYEVRAHTADEILEAWGPSREACLEEAVHALVESFADVSGAGWCRYLEVPLAGDDVELLVGLLDEVIFRLDADDGVPVRVRVRKTRGGVLVDLWLADRRRVTGVGAAPKGVSYSGLEFDEDDAGQWHCRAIVDV